MLILPGRTASWTVSSVFTDEFNRADEVVGDNANWTDWASNTSDLLVRDTSIVRPGFTNAGHNFAFYNGSLSSNQKITVKVDTLSPSVGSAAATAAGRFDGTSTFYAAEYDSTAGGRLALVRWVSGSRTQFWNLDSNGLLAAFIELNCDGDQITGTLYDTDGTTVIRTVTRTDTTITSGSKAGIGLKTSTVGNVNEVQIDAVTIEDLG